MADRLSKSLGAECLPPGGGFPIGGASVHLQFSERGLLRANLALQLRAPQVLSSEASQSSASTRTARHVLTKYPANACYCPVPLDSFISFSTPFLWAQLRSLGFPILGDLLCVLQGVPTKTNGPPCTLTR